MDRPPPKAWPVIKGLLAILSAVVAVFWLWLAIRFVSGFISPDSGDSPGHIGHLFAATFFVIMAGPFAAIAYVLGAPLFTRNPRFRGADR